MSADLPSHAHFHFGPRSCDTAIVLWIYFLLSDRFKSVLGPYDWFTGWVCDHCGFRAHAYVTVYGQGKGNSQAVADRMAYDSVPKRATQCLAAAPCPECGMVSRAAMDAFAWSSGRAARAERRRQTIPLGIAVGCAVLGIVPIIFELSHGPWFLLLVLAIILALSGFAMVLLTEPIPMPIMQPHGVWFQLANGWVQPPVGEAPAIAPVPTTLRTGGFIAAGAGLIATVVMGALWRDTFRTVYVVNTLRDQAVVVIVDGEPRDERVAVATSKQDIGFAEVEVRTSRPHRIVVREPDGREHGYDIDPSTSRYGWVFAPLAQERDVCLWLTQISYGSGTPRADLLLNGASPGDSVVLSNSIDGAFEEPPSTGNKDTTDTYLRAYGCRGR